MSYAIVQYLVVAALLIWSAGFGLQRMFPRTWRAAQAQVAHAMRVAPNAGVRALGVRLTPRQVATGGGCDSGGGCSTCGTCAPSNAPPSDVHPLVFQPRIKR